VFYGTGPPAPWNPEARPGDNKWTSGLFARDVRTGDARWFVSIDPHDLYALGAGGSVLLADLLWRGENRALLIHPDANGQVYVLDRQTGAILSAAPFVQVNATRGVTAGFVAAGGDELNRARDDRHAVAGGRICWGQRCHVNVGLVSRGAARHQVRGRAHEGDDRPISGQAGQRRVAICRTSVPTEIRVRPPV
jgi:hypothetical protein